MDAIPGFELAGAVVRRPFSKGGERVPIGTVLSAEDFLAIGYPVRRIFVANSQLTPFYRRPGDPAYMPPPPRDIEAAPEAAHHIIHRGGGRFDVVKGIILNDAPLTREAAEAIAKQGDQ